MTQSFRNTLEKNWKIFLPASLLVGFLLRMTFVEDMEYKEDEEYNFIQTQLIGNSKPWPWFGISSGVYLVNPGMSIWVFTILAKVFRIHTPTGLAHAVQIFALLGMSLIIPFALKWVSDAKERKIWLWAFALAMVNPFLVLYQRKLWPEPFLPFFTLLTLMGWWKRSEKKWSFTWGLVGAFIGQVHMSGFFFSAALFLWTAFFDPYRRSGGQRQRTNWPAWFLGSVVGTLPLIPWIIYVLKNPVQEKMSAGWNEIVQLKYWAFWLTNPTGLHLGNPLGLLRGPSNWDQISDFVRYPLVGGHATYLVGVAHLIALFAVLWIWGSGLRGLFSSVVGWTGLNKARSKKTASVHDQVIGKDSNTAFLQNSAFFGCGILLTLTGVVIRRYYMAVTFPLEFIFLIRMVDPTTQLGRRALTALWIAQLAISAGFVGYVHVNQGSTQGDYGEAYHLKQK